MFADEQRFAHHAALPAVAQFGDEGAANHTRFCRDYGEAGVEFFVYGRSAFDSRYPAPQKYPARQTLEASQAVARLHGLADGGVVFAQQNPAVIDAGVFHNDVIAVGNGGKLFYHEDAFLETDTMLAELHGKLASWAANFQSICVPRSEVSVEDAVRLYLFNSQLLSRDDGSMLLIVPEECRANQRVWALPGQLTPPGRPGEGGQSVRPQAEHAERRWPGLPARLRVALNETELARSTGVIMTAPLYDTLLQWVDKHYRDRLVETDLADPQAGGVPDGTG
jgi:succinylarginine dihydrolase